MILPFLPVEVAAPVQYDIVESPIGRLLLTGDERALTRLYMIDAGSRSVAAIDAVGGAGAPVQPDWVRRRAGFAAAATQLAEYFGGERTEFDLPLAPCGTRFQLAVWEELARIPYGKTVSYGHIATALGKTLVASRAVGLANGRNPISIIIPCHRVIGADGSLTGYGGGLDRKEWLLGHEGALSSGEAAWVGAGTGGGVGDSVGGGAQGTLW